MLTEADLDKLATISPYATGATIKDIVNEALVVAIRDGRDTVTWPDVLEAKHHKEHGIPDDFEYIERERHAIAIHEACHAVAFYRLDPGSTIDVATIERRGDVGGFVAPIPLDDQMFTWKSEREADIMISVASLAGERMFFDGDNSVGVGGDLRSATTVAMQMEAFSGMGSTVASHLVTKAVVAGAAGQTVETGTDRMWLETPFGERVERRLEALLQQVTRLLERDRAMVLAVAHALEAHRAVPGEDVAAIMEGTRGPTIDGAIYHDPDFQRQLEEYHRAAFRAHKDTAQVAMSLPGTNGHGEVVAGALVVESEVRHVETMPIDVAAVPAIAAGARDVGWARARGSQRLVGERFVEERVHEEVRIREAGGRQEGWGQVGREEVGEGEVARAGLEHVLHDDHVEPAVELAADLALDPDRREAACRVERDRCLVAADDAGHDGVEAVVAGQAYELAEDGLADAPALVGGIDVDRVLDRRGVGGPGAVRRQ